MDVTDPPAVDRIAQAREDYQRAVEILRADHAAALLRAKREMVGHCFKAMERLADDPTVVWPVYIAVVALGEDQRLSGWHFQATPAGDVQVREDTDIQAGFIAEHCTAVERNEFVAAFNELLTATARYVTRIPAVP